jgi:hypothetical protein
VSDEDLRHVMECRDPYCLRCQPEKEKPVNIPPQKRDETPEDPPDLGSVPPAYHSIAKADDPIAELERRTAESFGWFKRASFWGTFNWWMRNSTQALHMGRHAEFNRPPVKKYEQRPGGYDPNFHD